MHQEVMPEVEVTAVGGGVVVETTEEHAKKMWAGQSNILVAVRVRPLLRHDRVLKGITSVIDQKVRGEGGNRPDLSYD